MESDKTAHCHSACVKYAVDTIQNAKLDEQQARIKVSERNFNNLRYAYGNTAKREIKKN